MKKEKDKKTNSVNTSAISKMSTEVKLILGVVGFALLCMCVYWAREWLLQFLIICVSLIGIFAYYEHERTTREKEKIFLYKQDFANRLRVQLRISCFTIFDEVAHLARSLKVNNIDMLNNLGYLYSNNSLLFSLTIPKVYLSKDDKVADSTVAYINARLETLYTSYNTQIILCDNTLYCPLFYVTDVKDNGINITLYFVLKNWGDGADYAKALDEARQAVQVRTVTQDKVINDDF